MLDVFGLAFLFLIGTVIVVYVVAVFIAAMFYIADNWEEFSDTFKAIGVVLLIYLAWVIVIGGYKIVSYVAQPPTEITAELDDSGA